MAKTIPSSHRFKRKYFIVPSDQSIKLADYDPSYTGDLVGKEQGKELLKQDKKKLSEAQELIWASSKYSVLIIFQAMDAAGKDGTIKHVMTGVNPQGCNVHSFKAPNEEERRHHFLWRPHRYLPARGMITIFNRSYYEEVLITKIHNRFLGQQWVTPRFDGENLDTLWQSRYKDIRDTERRWSENGIEVIKFFLHVSKEEQHNRFLDRLNNPEKQWKFSTSDFEERKYWDQYQDAYETMLNATSTPWAPWYVIPADHKWFMRAVVADIIASRIDDLDLEYPKVSAEKKAQLEEIRKKMMKESKQ